MIKQIPLPNKKYQIIYADPPWKCWDGGNKNASKYYNCLQIERIYKLPVENIASENCALFLWIIFPLLPECIKTINMWGFKYSTNAFTWIKKNKKMGGYFGGCGYWTRANAEICLLGIRGKMKRNSKNVHQIIDEPISKHSEKPHIVREKIVELMGDLPRIELFARHKVKGWDSWGNEELREAYIQNKLI